jgi:hypothetical protein
MRLSEAIRLGSMLKPQGFGDLYVREGSCALGAAYDAIGAANVVKSGDLDAMRERLRAIWPFLVADTESACPVCTYTEGNLEYIIAHLNDFHGWTRERIADWVATIEPSEALSGDADQPVEVSCGVEETVAAVLAEVK